MIPLRDDNPVANTPYITYALILSCVIVFLYQLTLDARGSQVFIYSFGVIPAVLFDYVELRGGAVAVPAFATIFTSMFLHGGVMHLLGNMLYMWIFADNVEDDLGPRRFIVFYLVCGIAAALAQALFEPRSQVPMIGASGAVSGVLGAYLVMHPRAHVEGVVPPFLHLIRLPAVVVLGLWFGLQLLSSLSAKPGEPGIAFAAHLGGFVAGAALILLFRPGASRRIRRR
ncbi:MAG: rhomboid family intramembrane serine protease [Gammaproteobacteria bacterium]|nr:rhomboid family intramembrane serine protease [Gammaproteobacteria bacterium]